MLLSCQLPYTWRTASTILQFVPGSHLCAKHRSTFRNTACLLHYITAAAKQKELCISFLFKQNSFISRRQNFTLINIVNTISFKHTRFNNMSDTRFCHYRDRYRIHYFFHDCRSAIRATPPAAEYSSAGTRSQRHYSDSAPASSAISLFRIDDVHDDAAFCISAIPRFTHVQYLVWALASGPNQGIVIWFLTLLYPRNPIIHKWI